MNQIEAKIKEIMDIKYPDDDGSIEAAMLLGALACLNIFKGEVMMEGHLALSVLGILEIEIDGRYTEIKKQKGWKI